MTYDGITALPDTGYELTFRAKASDAGPLAMIAVHEATGAHGRRFHFL